MAAVRSRKSKSKSKHAEHLKSAPKAKDKPGKSLKSIPKFKWKFFLLITTAILASYYVIGLLNQNTAHTGDDGGDNNASSAAAADADKKHHQQDRHKTTTKQNEVERPEFEATICPEIVIPKNLGYAGRDLKIKELKHNLTESSVRIYLIDDFLTKEECDGLSAAHVRHVKKWNALGPLFCFSELQTFQKYLKEAGLKVEVTEKDFIPGTRCINETFSGKLREKFSWSYSTAFYRTESKFSKVFEERIEKVTGLLKTHGGKFQITSYPESVGYKSHTDCSIGSSDLRDRYATALVYLQNVRKGGETVFTNLGISVQPKQGRLIVWNNMKRDGECDPTSIHQAAPVTKGRKYILQRWYYFNNFPSLGKRMPEPDLPKRKEMQPRVSCDRFEEGSCRWYDEWNYDHLKEYNNKVEQLLL